MSPGQRHLSARPARAEILTLNIIYDLPDRFFQRKHRIRIMLTTNYEASPAGTPRSPQPLNRRPLAVRGVVTDSDSAPIPVLRNEIRFRRRADPAAQPGCAET